MRFYILISFFLFANLVNAKDIIPTFAGQIHNFSSIKSEKLDLTVDLFCEYKKGWLFPENVSCGRQTEKLQINQDGSFSVPALRYQERSSLRYYHVYLSFYRDGEPIKILQIIRSDIKKIPKLLENVSLFELPSHALNVATPNGEIYSSWRGFVIDNNGIPTQAPCVRIFTKLVSEKNYSWDMFPEAKSASDYDDAGFIRANYIMLPGALTPETRFLYDISYESYKSTQCKGVVAPKYQDITVLKGTPAEIIKQVSEGVITVD